MNAEQPKVVEIECESRIWGGARPIPSIHKHVGYVTYESADQIFIAPEFIYSSESRGLKIGHEIKETKVSIPKKRIVPLQVTPEKTKIIGIECEDPMHREGVFSNEKAKSFNPSVLRLLGYLVQEDEKCFRIAIATFEYRDGSIDYETVHVIPKSSILKTTYFKPKL